MISDEDVWRCTREELVHHVQRLQSEKYSLLHDHGNKMKDVNQRLQTHLLEIRNLKDINKKLQDDNQELRDLCCFLDDDRQKYRKLSKEWQRFGRYTSSVIKTEVATHQSKFKDLSVELESMLRHNEELKELVIYLDEERCSTQRDQGDGSSGNSDDNNLPLSTQTPSRRPGVSSDDAMRYIQHLEERIEMLEGQLKKQVEKSTENPWLSTNNIAQAMKILEVHNSLDKPGPVASPSSQSESSQAMGSREKTLLRELCNVAWKTLEQPTSTTPTLVPQNSRV